MKNSAPSRELQPRSDWKVLVPVGAGSPLLLAHAVTDAHLAFSSQKYVAIKLLLFLFLCCSCWHFCQPCTGFLSVLLVLGLHPCCPSLSACLPWGCWEGSGSGVLMPLPWCMNANNLVWKRGASTLERLTAFSSLRSCWDCSWASACGGFSALLFLQVVL